MKGFIGAHRQDPDAIIRVVRWTAAALAALQFGWASHDLAPATQAWGLSLAACLALVNVMSLAARRSPVPARARAGWLQLAADMLLALGVVWLLRHHATAPASAVLVLPLVEGAVRGRLAGAVLSWCVAVGAFLAVHLTLGGAGALAALQAGQLAMVALACGLLAENLGQKMEAEQEARVEAARRAQLLATVAACARDISSLDATAVLAGIVDSAIEIGFDCAEICVLTEDGTHWKSVSPRGLPPQYRAGVQPVGAGVAGLVYSSRAPVELDDYSEWDLALPALRSRGLRAVFAAPVWSGDRISAVLTAATYRPEPLTSSEREAVELLAAQASRALENARRFAERERLKDQLSHQAFHDALTGLPNRALLRNRLGHALGRARRDGTHVALVFCDLDGFKAVNDRVGHHAGDQLLVSVAARLELCVRPGDTVARFGGDEFTILLEEVTGVEEARKVALRIRETLEDEIALDDDQRVSVSASIGIAWTGGADVPDADRLLRQADRAMYLAKERGRGAVEVYDPACDARHQARLSLEADLRRCLEERCLDLHYQPLVRMADGRVAGLEALARWTHPELGPIAPDRFVPVAERSGIIVPLGRWVLEQACASFAACDVPGARLNVNVSVRQLEHGSFLADLERVLASSGLEPSRLVLELTEQAVIDDDDAQVRRTLDGLRAIAVQLAVDDFGRGFSSLRYLRELPVDEVKLDRSLVAGTMDTPEDLAIVRWTIELAHELGMRVTAEGIETPEQLRCLRELGCDLAQGFLFEPALPFEEAAAAVRVGVWPAHAAPAQDRLEPGPVPPATPEPTPRAPDRGSRGDARTAQH